MIPDFIAVAARLTRSALAVSLGGTLLLGAPTARQETPATVSSHPFTAMERAEYDVRYGPIHAGSGTLSVLGIETVRGRGYRFAIPRNETTPAANDNSATAE